MSALFSEAQREWNYIYTVQTNDYFGQLQNSRRHNLIFCYLIFNNNFIIKDPTKLKICHFVFLVSESFF